MLQDEVFVFPTDGTYLYEVQNGVPMTLLYERDIEDSSDELPVRSLDNFFIFDPLTNQRSPFVDVWESNEPREAFGQVLPEELKPGVEMEGEVISFRTSTILRIIPTIYK